MVGAQPCPLVRVACVKGVVRVTGEGRVSCDHSRDNWSRAAMANASTTGWDAGYAAIRDGKEVDELRKRLRAARRPDISYQYGRTASESRRPRWPWARARYRWCSTMCCRLPCPGS